MPQPVAEQIRELLQSAFSPEHIQVIDESSLHEGHAGARPEGESHFRVVIVSEAFIGIGRVQRQQKVYAALEPVFRDGLHALSMSTLTPDEYSKKDDL